MPRLAVLLFFALAASAQVKTSGMRRFDGFLPFYLDDKTGKIWIELDAARLGRDFLYVTSLPAGLGSNDVGLDRGKLTGTHLVRWERSGPKLMLVERNTAFRATSGNPYERAAVEQSFAESVLWGGALESGEGGATVADATTLFLRDAHGVARSLQQTRQGSFRLDAARSALHPPRTRNFPRNTEVEAVLTFAGGEPGAFVREVAPSPESITVRGHHTFAELPAGGYRPRELDPRAGYFGIEFFDYSTPIHQPIRKLYLSRHRLPPGGSITYYLDRGAPEPIRSALLDGARWWSDAFAAAGFPGAFKVDMLPEGADPMDLRYNVIQWVHRSTRGWSYGSTVTDPRTGEILKGHVTLGSLRVRQDFLIAEGLLAPYEDGQPRNPEMEKMALARLRQLSAHEVGHTLGLMHDYVSSAQGRASVMDYPHPYAAIEGPGAPGLSGAYTASIGEWDKVAIEYGYRVFGPGEDEAAGLRAILDKAHRRGLYFLSDIDARPLGSAHPRAHLWDNGANAADELRRLIAVRARVMERFGERVIAPERPMAAIEEALVPAYLMHRYQVEAAAKVVGGVDYRHALRGDGQKSADPVPGPEQRKALTALLATLEPEFLTLPEKLLRLIPPRPPEHPRTRESFPSRTGLTFDPVAAAESAAALTVSALLHPERAARLAQLHARDASLPGIEEVAEAVLLATWKGAKRTGLAAEVQRAVAFQVLHRAMSLANTEAAGPRVRAAMHAKLDALRQWAAARAAEERDEAWRAHFKFAADQIREFRENPGRFTIPPTPAAPPGQPIGCGESIGGALADGDVVPLDLLIQRR